MREMLECVDSREIGEWMAYEKAFGPIGPEWSNAALMAIHSQLMLIAKMTGAAHWGNDSPVQGDMPSLPRPEDFFRKEEDSIEVEDDDDDDDETE